MIRFSCIKGHYFEKTEEELREAKQSFRYCWCGEKLKVKIHARNVQIADLKHRLDVFQSIQEKIKNQDGWKHEDFEKFKNA